MFFFFVFSLLLFACNDEVTSQPTPTESSEIVSSSVNTLEISSANLELSSSSDNGIFSSVQELSSEIEYGGEQACYSINLDNAAENCIEVVGVKIYNDQNCKSTDGIEIKKLLQECPIKEKVPLVTCKIIPGDGEGLNKETLVHHYKLPLGISAENQCQLGEAIFYEETKSSVVESSSSEMVSLSEGRACYVDIPALSAGTCVQMTTKIIQRMDCESGIVLEQCPENAVSECQSEGSTQFYYGDLYTGLSC